MKLIIDCNVIISACINDGTCREVILRLTENGIIYLSRDILLGYIAVTQRDRFYLMQNSYNRIINDIIEASEMIETKRSSYMTSDVDDIKYLDLAFTTKGAIKYNIDTKI